MKKFVLVIAVVVLGGGAWSQTPNVESSSAFSAGFINSTTGQVGSLSWKPDFHFSDFGLGLDVSVPLGDKKPSGYENVVVRYVEYAGRALGARYGIFDHVTLGQGLLMKDYSTRTTGTVFQNNKQNGVRAYWNGGTSRVELFTTATGITAVRVQESLDLFKIGQYYITDSDGVTVTPPSGPTRTLPPLSAYGIDATYPTIIPALDLYAEYAQIVNFGSGFAYGLQWGYDFIISKALVRFERRQLAADFAPGIFNAEYEVNPIDFAAYRASSTARDAYVGALDMAFMNYATLKGEYLAYNGSHPAGKATLKVSEVLFPGYDISGYYIAPDLREFRGLSLSQGAVIGAQVGYKINPYTKVIMNYKRAYNPATAAVEDSTSYEFSFGM